MSPLPELSEEQRAAALEKAAQARRVRADVKNQLKMGFITFDELLVRADEVDNVGKLKALSALESMPGLGKVKARRLMTDIGIADNRRLRGLGEAQRRRLSEFFAPQDSSDA